jgi:hypothetical protein
MLVYLARRIKMGEGPISIEAAPVEGKLAILREQKRLESGEF